VQMKWYGSTLVENLGKHLVPMAGRRVTFHIYRLETACVTVQHVI
jgi:hypothetical protein